MKLFYSDVDDTLITLEGMSQNLIDFLIEFYKREDLFIPCSGRPLISMIKTFSKFKLKYVIGFNGGQIYDLEKREIIFEQKISKKECDNIISELKKLNVDFLLYKEDSIYASDINNEYAKIESVICEEPLKEISEIFSTVKILGLVDPKENTKVVESLKQRLPEFEVFKSKDYFIEITPKGVNKGAAVEKLSKILNIQNKDIYCFGDSHNDISMFNLDVNKIAVQNATKEIKDLADEETYACEDDGVVKYIQKLYNEK